MKTTRKEVEGVFSNWIHAINGRVAKSWNDVSAYRLDYCSCYGGYRVEQICNESGGVRDVTNRLTASAFVAALRVSMRSIEEKDANPVTVAQMDRVIKACKTL